MHTKFLFVGVTVAFLIACTPDQLRHPGHYEIVTYRLKDGVTASDYLSTGPKVEVFLKSQPGFFHRGAGQVNDSIWIDVLTWRSKSDFEKAFEKSAEDPAIIEMTKMIDESTYQIYSFSPQ